MDNEDMKAVEAGASRRNFLKAATATAAGMMAGLAAPGEVEAAVGAEKAPAGAYKMASGILVPVADTKKLMAGPFPKAPVTAKGRVRGANDRIGVAFVGTGGMGGAQVQHFSDHAQEWNVEVLGVIDVNQKKREERASYAKGKGAAGANLIVDKDYRKILDNPNIDAVVIATPEHWHAQIACHAMEAGKSVYIQKPMTRYLDEAFQVYDTAKRTGKIVQVGSQGCSDYRFHAAGKAIREGKAGPLVMGQGSYTRNSATGEWNYDIDGSLNPDNLDWEMWLGSAPKRPWDQNTPGAGGGQMRERDDSRARYNRYRKYWDYSAGILGDLMPHKLHPFLIASGNPEYPVRVAAIGTKLGNDREVPDTVQVVAEFPSKWTMLFVGSTVNEQGLQDMFRGYKASIYFGNGVELKPERWASEEVEAANIPLEGPTGEPHERHEENWLQAIRANDPMKANCNYELATKVQTIISLAEMSMRLNRTMLFDEKTRKISYG